MGTFGLKASGFGRQVSGFGRRCRVSVGCRASGVLQHHAARTQRSVCVSINTP